MLDGAIDVFDGVAGVEPQTESHWRLADEYGVVRIAFVAKLDRVGADFDRVVSMIGERLGVRALALQLPVCAEGTLDVLRTALRKGVLAGAFVPVLGGSAYKNRGIEPLLDAVVDWLPSPGDVVATTARPAADANEPLVALAFKLAAAGHGGHGGMVFARIYRGRLRRGDRLRNATTNRVERVSRLLEVHADEHIEIARSIGRRDRRSAPPPRLRARTVDARRIRGGRGARAARGDVRLRRQLARAVEGARALLDAVRSVRADGAGESLRGSAA